jgi:hypothetical protein
MAMDWDKLRVFHAVAEAGSFGQVRPRGAAKPQEQRDYGALISASQARRQRSCFHTEHRKSWSTVWSLLYELC